MFTCLQETCHDEEVYSSELNGHLIFVRGKDEAAHHNYGQGFYISNKWYNNLLDIQYISNRISVIQFLLNILDKTNILTIINVYAPTSLISQKSPEKLQYFYEQLEQSYLFYKARSSLIFLCGDFNSKLGKEKGNELFMGHYGKGSRNKNGEQFAQFLLQHHLYCANTHFTQSIRHISTWHG
jgi:exonuclease III